MMSSAADRVETPEFAATLVEQRFKILLAANRPALERLAASYANTVSDRDDLLQEIALAIWRALPSFRGECSERTFLYRIAHNCAIDHLARRRPAGDGEEIEIRDPRPDPETGLARAQRGEQLVRAIQRLPVLYRQVITLALEGMEYSEIAPILGISENNVGVRLSRARQLLRTLLEEWK